MPTDSTQVLEALVTSVRKLALDDSYKEVASVLEEIPQLKVQLTSKDAELDRLKADIVTLKTSHEDHVHQNLETFCTERNKFTEEKAQLSKEVSTLRAEIQKRDVATAEGQRTQAQQQEQLQLFEKRLREEKKKVEAANTKVTKLEQSVKGKDAGLEKLKESLRNEKAQVSELKRELEALSEEKSTMQQELDLSRKRLSKVVEFMVELHGDETGVMIDQLDNVWESALRLVESLFEEGLDAKSLVDIGAWKNLRESPYLDRFDRVIPLPQSNSSAAKQMRVAAVLAILARCIDLYIFQPTYLPDEEDFIRPLLNRLAMKDSKKESFCRAILLSLFPEDQARIATKGRERVVGEVLHSVSDLLSEAQRNSFRSGLEHVVQQAHHAWQRIQFAREKFEPLFVLKHFQDLEWEPLRFNDGGERSRSQGLDIDDALLVIFPRIYIIEDNEPDPITPGVVLMRSQSMAAANEIERQNASSPTIGRAGPRSRAIRSRTKSTSINGASDFLSERMPLKAQ